MTVLSSVVPAVLLLVTGAALQAAPSDAGANDGPPAAASSAAAAAAAAPALRAKFAMLRPRLEHSAFSRHLYVESIESAAALQGDVYAQVDHAFAAVAAALLSPAGWCDALILHLNVKYCRPFTRGGRTFLVVAVGTKYDQPLSEAFRVEFAFGAPSAAADYLQVDLGADKGPLGTTDYRIELQAVALDAGGLFLHLRYAYRYGLKERLATQAYLATAARGKVGFTSVADEDGVSHFIGGTRGAVERNAMRYYLAIEAYLGTLAAPAAERPQARFERWFDATEQYPRQLHEVDRDAYLAMKRREYLRQQTVQ